MAIKPLPPWTNEQILKSLLNRVARLKRLIELGAPAIIIEGEKHLVRDALAMLPTDEAAVAEIAERQKKNEADRPRLEARAQEMYEQAGNKVPWDDADASTQHVWLGRAIEEDFGMEPDTPDTKRMH